MTTVTAPTLKPERVRTLAHAIEEAGQAFDMREWLSVDRSDLWNHEDPVGSSHDCGAVACAAGWAVMLFDSAYIYRTPPLGEMPDIRQRATDLLGLGDLQSRLLFIISQEERDIRCRYDDILPKRAADTLRHLADTGKVEWQREPPQMADLHQTVARTLGAGHPGNRRLLRCSWRVLRGAPARGSERAERRL